MCLLILDNISIKWLSNSSFQTQAPIKRETFDLSSSSDESLLDIPNSEKLVKCETALLDTKLHTKQEELKTDKIQKTKRKKRTYDSKRYKIEYEQDVQNVYFEDKHRDKGNNNINTFCPRVRPSYEISEKFIGFIKHKQPKKDIFHRYYVKNIDSVESLKKKDTVIKRTTENEISTQDEEISENISFWCKNLEEEQKCKTREYNEQLAEDPYNVELWLQYINFQVINKMFFINMEL